MQINRLPVFILTRFEYSQDFLRQSTKCKQSLYHSGLVLIWILYICSSRYTTFSFCYTTIFLLHQLFFESMENYMDEEMQKKPFFSTD